MKIKMTACLIAYLFFCGCFVHLREGTVKDKHIEIYSPADLNHFSSGTIIFMPRYYLIVCDDQGRCDKWSIRELEYTNINVGDVVARP